MNNYARSKGREKSSNSTNGRYLFPYSEHVFSVGVRQGEAIIVRITQEGRNLQKKFAECSQKGQTEPTLRSLPQVQTIHQGNSLKNQATRTTGDSFWHL